MNGTCCGSNRFFLHVERFLQGWGGRFERAAFQCLAGTGSKRASRHPGMQETDGYPGKILLSVDLSGVKILIYGLKSELFGYSRYINLSVTDDENIQKVWRVQGAKE